MGERDGNITVLNMNDFINIIDSNIESKSLSPTKKESIGNFPSSSNIEDIILSIRNRVQLNNDDKSLTSSGMKKITIAGLENTFKEICNNNNRENRNNVTKQQFVDAMEQIGIRLRAIDIDGLFKLLSTDKRNNDKLNYNDFIDALIQPSKIDSRHLHSPISTPRSPKTNNNNNNSYNSKMDRK